MSREGDGVTVSDVGFRSERGPILVALMLSVGVIAIDSTILATAVPTIVAELGGFASFPWLFSGYLLTQAVTVPVYSKLADMFGRKPTLLVGIGLFLLGSIACALAWDMLSLIVFRALQGVGAGAILPIAMTIAGDIYTVAERARVQGYLASVWAIAAVVGPTLGGVFAQFVDWRWIFWVNLPLCLLAGGLIWRAFRERVARTSRRIDFAGSALLMVALTLLLLGLLQGGVAWEWWSPPSLLVFAGAVVLLAVFVVVEMRAAEPILPFGVVRRRIVLTTSLSAAVVGMVLMGLTTYVPTYLEGSLDLPPIWAGLALAALTVGWPLASTLSGRVYLRIGFRNTTFIGAAIVVLAVAALALVAPYPNVVVTALCCFVTGLGLGLLASPSLIVAQASVAWEERGVVTGANAFLRTLGSTVGVAILGAVTTAVLAGRPADDAAAITDASTAVFAVSAGAAVLALVTVTAMPRTPPPPRDEVGELDIPAG